MNEKVEDWNGFSIHFVQFEGSWLWVADLEDICDALDLSADVVLNDIDRDYIFEMYEGNPFKIGISEEGIYQLIYFSHEPMAMKFKTWSYRTLTKLRKMVGLQLWESLKLLDEKVQRSVDHILDTIYWDEEKKCVMQSVTLPGGDVDQVPFFKKGE